MREAMAKLEVRYVAGTRVSVRVDRLCLMNYGSEGRGGGRREKRTEFEKGGWGSGDVGPAGTSTIDWRNKHWASARKECGTHGRASKEATRGW